MRTDGNKKMQGMREGCTGLLLFAEDGHLRKLSYTGRDEEKRGEKINGRNKTRRIGKHAGKSCL